MAVRLPCSHDRTSAVVPVTHGPAGGAPVTARAVPLGFSGGAASHVSERHSSVSRDIVTGHSHMALNRVTLSYLSVT